MAKKATGVRKPIKLKGVRAENAPSLVAGPSPRAPKVSPKKRKEAEPSPHASRSTTSPVHSPKLAEQSDATNTTALYGASWVSPAPGIVSSLSEEDALLLRGISPGSTSAQWYRSLRTQLSDRAVDSTAEADSGRPASANAALVIPHGLIDDTNVPNSQPASPSAFKQPRGPPHAHTPTKPPVKRSDPAVLAVVEEATRPVPPYSVPSSSASTPHPPHDTRDDSEPDHNGNNGDDDDNEEDLPVWLRDDDDVVPPPAVTETASSAPPSRHPRAGGERRRTDLDRLQSLRRMMEVNHKTNDTFSSQSSVNEESVPSPGHDGRNRKAGAKAKGHHLPPLSPSHNRNAEACPASVEIAMSHGSDSSLFRGRAAHPTSGAVDAENVVVVVAGGDGDARYAPYAQPSTPVGSGNVLDLRALRNPIADVPPPTRPAGRVVVMSLGNLGRSAPTDSPGSSSPADGPPQSRAGVSAPVQPPRRPSDIPPVERMAPKLREKREQALMHAHKKKNKKRALPPLSS